MEIKFREGDLVVYGTNGICHIEAVKYMKFGKLEGMYYVLKPQASASSTHYVPVDREELTQKMRPLLSKQEIDRIIQSAKNQEFVWPESKNQRNELFSDIISRADMKELVGLVHCIYLKKQEKLSQGKHLSSSDDSVMKIAQKLIEEEFSLSLGCSPEQVSQYIRMTQ